MLQTAVVAVLVVVCALRAAWLLAPAAARRSVARALIASSLPRALTAPLGKHAQAANGTCACDGCDKNADAAAAGSAGAAESPPTVAPITFHRRLPR